MTKKMEDGVKKPIKKTTQASSTNASDVRVASRDWSEMRPLEMERMQGNKLLRIKQSFSRVEDNIFWYCYSGGRYLGVEKTQELAKARAEFGRMRVAGEDLADWLRQHVSTLPPALLASERERLAHWKKFPRREKATTIIDETVKVINLKEVPKPGGAVRVTIGGREVRTAKPAPSGKLQRYEGPLAQSAVVVVLKPGAFMGKPGTKWRGRQEHVIKNAGRTVLEIRDNDAVRILMHAGIVGVR